MRTMTVSQRLFQYINYGFLFILILICLLPMMHVLSISFSSNAAIAANKVLFWPVEFTTGAYEDAMENPQLWTSLGISVLRVVLSVGLGLFVTALAGYVLSQGGGRDGIAGYKFMIVFFVIALLFNGGLIPSYMVVTGLGLNNSIWALVVPGLTNVFYIVLMVAFMRDLPKSLSEAAFIDGANHFQVFFKVILPLSVPVIAVVGIFMLVFEWNEFFYGQIYMQSDQVPLSTYVHRMLAVPDFSTMDPADVSDLNNRALNAATVVFAALPIVVFFPILQKFHTKGITIGSVKE